MTGDRVGNTPRKGYQKRIEFPFVSASPFARLGGLKRMAGHGENERQKQMKTYTSSYTPAPFIALAAIRKLELEKLEQAIDATLTGLKGKTEFTGLVRAKGEKGEFDAITETIARMPQGTVKDCLVYFGNVKRAEKSAAKVGGVVTLADFPATLTEWFKGFTKPEPDSEAAKAAKEAAKAAKLKAKQEAKDAIKATEAQLAGAAK